MSDLALGRMGIPGLLGDAAMLVDPVNTDALADGLRLLVHDADARKRLAMRGRARALTYTWEQTGRQTVAAYRRIAG